MALWKADEPIHSHSRQRAHEKLAPRSVRTAYQQHLCVERREVCLRILHPREGHLGPRECTGYRRLQDCLREWCCEFPRWGCNLRFISTAPSTAQLLVGTMEFIVSRMRSCSTFEAAIASCSPSIMPMSCCMVISSLLARVGLVVMAFWKFS